MQEKHRLSSLIRETSKSVYGRDLRDSNHRTNDL